MTSQEEQQQESEYGVLTLANHILEALGQELILDDPLYLFNDEFYLSIVSNIVPENNIDSVPGETDEEKVKKLDQLINYLSSIVELDLSHISSYGIIFEQDEQSAKTLLELIFQLISILKSEEDTNSQLINDEDLRVDSELLEDYNNRNNNNNKELSNNKPDSNDNDNDVEIENEDNDMYRNNQNNYNIDNEMLNDNNTNEGNLMRSNNNNNYNDNDNDNDMEYNNDDNNFNENNLMRSNNNNDIKNQEYGNLDYNDEDDINPQVENIDNYKNYNNNNNENNQDNEDNDNNEHNDNTDLYDNNINNENNHNEHNISNNDINPQELNNEYADSNINNARNKNQNTTDDRVTDSNLNDNSKFDIEKDKPKSCNDISSFSYNSSKNNYTLNDVSRYMSQINILNQAQEILLKADLPEEYLHQFENFTDKEKIQVLLDIQQKQILNEGIQQLVEDNYLNNNINNYNSEGRGFYNHSKRGSNVPNEESKSVNISRISEVSKSKENSEAPSQQKFLNKHASTASKQNKTDSESQKAGLYGNASNSNNNMNNSGSNMKNSYIPSKISSIETKINNDIKNNDNNFNNIESNDQNYNENIPETSNNNTNTNNNNKINRSKVSNNTNTSNSKYSKPLQQSQYSNNNNNKRNQVNKEKSRSEMSMSSVKSISSKNKNNNNNNSNENKNVEESLNSRQSKQSDLIIEELPLNDENLKFEIMKEFKRIYGNNLHRLFLKENLSKSSNTLELIIRNLKVAKSRMTKMGVQQYKDPDDLLTKEFMLRYQKELEYILNYYQNEERKRNFMKEKAIKSITKNVNIMKKIQEISANNIHNEIERRNKGREFKAKENKIKLCNEIYSKALQFEKQKFIEETVLQSEIRKKENEEKRLIMTQIENYYKDKITMLKETLHKEKREKEIQYRAQLQFFSQLDREKRHDFKNKVDTIFQQLEQEDKKEEFRTQNDDKVNGILNAYYK